MSDINKLADEIRASTSMSEPAYTGAEFVAYKYGLEVAARLLEAALPQRTQIHEQRHQELIDRLEAANQLANERRNRLLSVLMELEVQLPYEAVDEEIEVLRGICKIITLSSRRALAAEVELKAKLKAAEQDRAFYKCCALSGEAPAEGSEPSAILKDKDNQEHKS